MQYYSALSSDAFKQSPGAQFVKKLDETVYFHWLELRFSFVYNKIAFFSFHNYVIILVS